MLSIIDGSSIDTVHVIDFPFSDHSIVIAECKFDSLDKGFDLSSYIRNLNDKNINLILNDLKNSDFNFIDDIHDAEVKYFYIKRLIMI